MLKIISAVLIIGGFIFVLGTVGSADLNLISFVQIIVRCAIGLGLMFGGLVIKCIAENLQMRRK